jgi:uncharacterized RDD family membrane protein YckC
VSEERDTRSGLEEALRAPVRAVLDRPSRALTSAVAERVAEILIEEGVVERTVDRALKDPGTERAAIAVLDSELLDEIVEPLLASNEIQQVIERIANAPEVRNAITRQGVGLLEDVRRGVRRRARQVDTALENAARRVLRRPVRERRPIYAGAFSRMLAIAIDAGVVYGSLLLLSAAVALLFSAFTKGDEHASTAILAAGASAWALIAGTYLVVFWSGAGRTPGMSFLAIRMLSGDGSPVQPRQAIRRLVWMPISALPLFLGFRGVLSDQERRGWPDRRAGTLVCYADPELDKGILRKPA